MGGVKFQPGSIRTGAMPPLPALPGSGSRTDIAIGGMRVLKASRPDQPATIKQALVRKDDGVAASRQQVTARLGTLPTGVALASIRTADAGPGAMQKLRQQLANLNPFARNQGVTDKEPAQALHDILASAPKTLQRHPNWANVVQRMQNYIDTTRPLQHTDFRRLLNTPDMDLFKLMGSLKSYSKLDATTGRAMAFQRDLANIGMMGIGPLTASMTDSGVLNADVLGNDKSYLSSHPDSDAAKPGNQLSLAMDTVLRRADGALKHVTVLSSPAPALDSPKQPEWRQYVGADGRLDTAMYRVAMEAIKDHNLSCASSHAGPRVVLTGIGTSSFLSGLCEEDKTAARAIVAEVLADVSKALKDMGKQVAFYDKSDTFCNRLNEINKGDPTIAYLGKLEANWEDDGDLILNAWDPNSLIGNGLALDQSGDGILCRHTLLHLQHALASAMHAEGMI